MKNNMNSHYTRFPRAFPSALNTMGWTSCLGYFWRDGRGDLVALMMPGQSLLLLSDLGDLTAGHIYTREEIAIELGLIQ